MLKVIEEESPWYKNGLHFKCTECGQCCTGAPGYVWVGEEEVEEMAKFLNISVEEFSRRYLRKVLGRLSLLENPKTYDCVFLKEKKCQLYKARPKQCRTYPWWPALLKTEKDWIDAAEHCEGINAEAPIVPFEVIEHQRLIQEGKIPYDVQNNE